MRFAGAAMTRIEVTAERTYPVIIGRGLLGDLLPILHGAQRVALIHPGALMVSAQGIEEELRGAGHETITIEIPEGEDAKTIEVAGFCWNALAASGFTRTDAIVSVGGGATTDLAGFVAATWLRGVPLVHIPTTLLAMVDAAVGGKTGINLDAGKNLVGSFYSPKAVLCDVNALDSLPEHDLRAGLAEVVKVGLTNDPTIVADILANPDGAVDPQGALLEDLIRRAVQVKANVVAADFLEDPMSDAVGREVLNYGHTFGHAIEKVERYKWRHGAAVSIGLVYVAELAHLAGRLSAERVAEHRRVLEVLGLPTSYAGADWPPLFEAMAIDKKARGSALRFVIMTDAGRPAILHAPDPALLQAAFAAVSA
jgi:3-dehydroquinate synthase